jgi:hypothetical protein
VNPLRENTQIVDLEAHMTPSTPPKERETREKTMTTMVESIKTLELECAQVYTKIMGIWVQLNEDKEKQNIIQKIQVA